MELEFNKYQGLGNDFVVVEVSSLDQIPSATAQKICDRHFGIGADGVLLVLPSEQSLAKMVVINADGSRPEMCGNGLRCVALHLARGGASDRFHVETDAGTLECALARRGSEDWITISLGRAKELPTLDLKLAGKDYAFHRISMGNPHAVLFDSEHTIPEIDQLGPQVSAAIEGGANIEFVRPTSGNSLNVVVWERGVGRTLACGTGAGAVATAAALEGRVNFNKPTEVMLPGGALELTVEREKLGVELCGPAKHVFSGHITL